MLVESGPNYEPESTVVWLTKDVVVGKTVSELGPSEPETDMNGDRSNGDVESAKLTTLTPRSLCAEALDILWLAVPIFFSRMAWTTIKTTDTALVGHVGTNELAAVALSDLYTSSTGCLVMGRVLGVFASQAYGSGNKKLAGVWLQVSLVVLFVVAIAVSVAWSLTGPFLNLTDADDKLIPDAAYYAIVLMTCLPARISSGQINQFFQAQRIMHPSVICSVLAASLNLMLGLPFVLGIPIPGWKGFGFVATPIVTVVVEYAQLLTLVLVFCWGLGLHRECWPGGHGEHITKERLASYTKMYVPAALSIASDYWRLAAIGTVAAGLGTVELAVFTSSYRIMWMCLIFSSAVAAASAIKMGQAFGKGQHREGRGSALLGLALALVGLMLLGLLVAAFPEHLAMLFSSDPTVIAEFKRVALPLASTAVSMNMQVALEQTMVGMGRTNVVLGIGLIGSWAGQVPGVLLCTWLWRNDLVGLYTGVTIGYSLACLIYVGLLSTTNWQVIAEEALERSEKVDRAGEEGKKWSEKNGYRAPDTYGSFTDDD